MPPDVQHAVYDSIVFYGPAPYAAVCLQFTSKGTVDGGYVDNRKLRLALHAEHKAKRQALQALQSELLSIQVDVPKIDEKIKTAQHTVLTADKARKAAEGAVSRVKEKLAYITRQVCFSVTMPERVWSAESVCKEYDCRLSRINSCWRSEWSKL